VSSVPTRHTTQTYSAIQDQEEGGGDTAQTKRQVYETADASNSFTRKDGGSLTEELSLRLPAMP